MRPYGAILADNIANGSKKLKEEQPATKIAKPATSKIESNDITNFRQSMLGDINGQTDNK